MADEKVRAIVIDNGSCTSKVGFAGDDAPRVIFPSVVGHPKHYDPRVGKSWLHCLIGNDTEAKKSDLDFLYPVKNGIVTDWDEMYWIWDHILIKEFSADNKRSPVLLTEAPLNPKPNREKATEVMFETFDVPALYMATQEVLALYSSGRTTGIVFNSGDGVSHAVPVYQGYSLPRAIVRLELAGRHVTDYLGSLLMQCSHSFATTAEMEIPCKIKEKLCYVALDFEHELSSADSNPLLNQSYDLPDGRCVDVGCERFQAPECLFKPSLIGKPDMPGIHKAVVDAVRKCGVELVADLFRNIVLTGGSSLLSGIEKRMEKEIAYLAVPLRARVSFTPECTLAAWIGGSILASLSGIEEMWISKDEYNETGPAIVHLKCFQ